MMLLLCCVRIHNSGTQFVKHVLYEIMQEGNVPVDFTEHVVIPAHDAYRLRGDMAGKYSLIGQFLPLS
jgi:hypothetical protein